MKDQPRNKKRRPDLKTLLTNKRKKLVTSDSSSEEEDDRFSLQDSENSKTFSEFENQTNLPIPDVQASDFLKYLQVGDFVLVRYEGELYPGKIIDLEKEEVLISAMKKSASNWKWPSTPDQILYSMDEIVQKVDEPIQSGR